MISLPRNSALALAVIALLSGCADYMNNRDAVTLGAGDAMEGNLGMSTIDPFPPDAKNTRIRVESSKVKQAHDRYVAPCDPDVVKCAAGASGSAISINIPAASSGGGAAAGN